ncbi:MAG: hypothetical protein HY667_04180 [Chloroflexi bacterium]|nr:hypothetical protein [Chloroflexota bacterium]
MPYLAELEKAGIPTVVVDFADQDNMVREEALVNGVPNIRYLQASRTLPGPADVEQWIRPMLEALTRPLTDKEKESGLWNPPQPRVLFEGTLEEAEAFYQQSKWIPHPVNAPLSVYTDGFPITVPTEERVRAMLKGTSHRPEEVLTLQADITSPMGQQRKKGDLIRFQPLKRTATVEKVAINAVMAGCKPEHLPVILAIAQSGCPISTTNFPSQAVCLSGPIVKELQMNVGVGMLGPGSPVNGPIGRAYQLMAINLGGAVPGVNRMGCLGSPLNNGGTCFAENADGLPSGWKGLNEETGFKKDESVVMVMNITGGVVGSQFSPGGYRAFQKSGHGGLARRFDVKGKPGPHNWLEYIFPGLFTTREGAWTVIMVPEMAQHLVDIGFKTKDEVYEWIWKRSFEPLKDYRNRSWPDFFRNGWTGIEKTSGKPWKELSEDYMVPAGGDNPRDCVIIVAGGDEEASMQLAGGRDCTYSIDVWR